MAAAKKRSVGSRVNGPIRLNALIRKKTSASSSKDDEPHAGLPRHEHARSQVTENNLIRVALPCRISGVTGRSPSYVVSLGVPSQRSGWLN
jgi:hypothetical protein